MLWKLLFGILGPIAIAGGLWFALSHYYEHKGAAPYIAALAADKTTIATLEGELADQNTRVIGLKAAGDARVKAGQDALRAIVARQRPSLASIDAMTRSGAVVRAQDAPCVISDALASAKGL